MPISINIPTPLRSYTNQQKCVQVQAKSVSEAIDALLALHPVLSKHLLKSNGGLRSFINIYLGDEDIRSLEHLETELEDGDELSIIPSIAGGIA